MLILESSKISDSIELGNPLGLITKVCRIYWRRPAWLGRSRSSLALRAAAAIGRLTDATRSPGPRCLYSHCWDSRQQTEHESRANSSLCAAGVGEKRHLSSPPYKLSLRALVLGSRKSTRHFIISCQRSAWGMMAPPLPPPASSFPAENERVKEKHLLLRGSSFAGAP